MKPDSRKRIWVVVWTDADGGKAAVEHRGRKRHTLAEAQRIADDMNAVNPHYIHRAEKAPHKADADATTA